MKRIAILMFCLLLAFSIVGCGGKSVKKIRTIESEYRMYYEMSDGTWMSDDNIYKYRLEVSGKMPNASKSSTFVYLSNIEEISFEQAWKTAGFSSNSENYFNVKDAVLVECR